MRRAPLLLVALVACGSTADRATTATQRADSVVVTVPADSQVSSAGGRTLWFTLARHDSGASGPCEERALEIRSDGNRQLVPLLYTREAPVPESDTTVLVHLWQECAPAQLYRVDLRTGQPVAVRP